MIRFCAANSVKSSKKIKWYTNEFPFDDTKMTLSSENSKALRCKRELGRDQSPGFTTFFSTKRQWSRHHQQDVSWQSHESPEIACSDKNISVLVFMLVCRVCCRWHDRPRRTSTSRRRREKDWGSFEWTHFMKIRFMFSSVQLVLLKHKRSCEVQMTYSWQKHEIALNLYEVEQKQSWRRWRETFCSREGNEGRQGLWPTSLPFFVAVIAVMFSSNLQEQLDVSKEETCLPHAVCDAVSGDTTTTRNVFLLCLDLLLQTDSFSSFLCLRRHTLFQWREHFVSPPPLHTLFCTLNFLGVFEANFLYHLSSLVVLFDACFSRLQHIFAEKTKSKLSSLCTRSPSSASFPYNIFTFFQETMW